MATKKITALTELSDPILTDLLYVVDDPGGSPVSNKLTLQRLGLLEPHVCQGRLTLESGVAVSTTDQTAKTTVYFTPYFGNRVAVYDGTRWVLWGLTEISVGLGTLVSATNYDVFAYDSSGTLTLKLGPAWTSDTARGTGAGTTELTTQDGVYVNAVSIASGPGAKAGRYLGTIRTTATTTTEDSAAKRFVWNAAQRTSRVVRVVEATNSWTVDTWRYVNNASANRVEVVVGLAGETINLASLLLTAGSASPSSKRGLTGIGYDSSAAPVSGCVYGSVYGNDTVIAVAPAALQHAPGLGWHYYAWLESYEGTAPSAYGDDGGVIQSGLSGIWAA